jgi:hypothetical protein
MPHRLFDLYQRKRIVNINANILMSGLLAVLVAKYPVDVVGRLIGEDHKILITLAAGGIDMVIDVALYYALHWVANHWTPPWKRQPAARPERAFFRDASLIQFERAILSPLYYLIAMGSMLALQHRGWVPGWAFLTAFASGLLVTRVVHTAWGLRSGLFVDESCPSQDSDQSPPPVV